MSIRILTTTLTLIFFVAACSTDEPVSTAGLITPEVQDSVISIETLSTKPWIVSGGDVLIEVRVSEPSFANALRVELNGTDVTQRFIDVSTHRKQALLRGLPEGDSNLTASLSGTDESTSLLSELRRHERSRWFDRNYILNKIRHYSYPLVYC